MENFFQKKENNLERKERPKKKIFVEIGCGGLAIPALIGSKSLKGYDYYGIEVNSYDLEISKALTEAYIKMKKRDEDLNDLHFLNIDAGQLPFDDRSVDEIFFGNFFSAPKRGFNFSQEGIIEEVRRVLKDDGILIIKENLFFPREDYEKLKKKLEDFGFMVEKEITFEDGQLLEEELKKWEGNFFKRRIGFNDVVVYLKKRLEDNNLKENKIKI